MNDILTHDFTQRIKMNRRGCTAYSVEPDMNIFIHGSTYRTNETGHSVV